MVLTSVALIPVVLGVLGLIAAFGIYRIVYSRWSERRIPRSLPI